MSSNNPTQRLYDEVILALICMYSDYQFKIVVTGEISVGKTSIIRRFVENKFELDYLVSIGVDIVRCWI